MRRRVPGRDSVAGLFAVEDDAVQLMWRDLPADWVTVEVGDRAVEVNRPAPAILHRRRFKTGGRRPDVALGHPGATVVSGLSADTSYDVLMSGPGLPRKRVTTVKTLAPPPGRQLGRFATISDLHLGERHFGAMNTIVPGETDAGVAPAGADAASAAGAAGPAIEDGYTYSCARAAIDQALEWGAEMLLVKGDLTHDARPAEFEAAAKLLEAVPVRVLVVLGNHDARVGPNRADGTAILRSRGIEVTADVSSHPFAGLTVVMVHTPTYEHRRGAVDAERRKKVADAVGGAPGAAFVAVHHQPDPRKIRWAYPPGMVTSDAGALLDAIAVANPSTFVSAGHTHQHHRRTHGPLVVTEVGSTKDFPGGWAGYAVHEGGIRQVVRRTAGDETVQWTEATGASLFGLWAPWSVGRLDWRCFSHPWTKMCNSEAKPMVSAEEVG